MNFTDFKQFVSSSVCLSCDGCCRFREPNSSWRPLVMPEETNCQGTRLLELLQKEGVLGAGEKIKTKACGQEHLCHLFNSGDHTCGIYTQRPFECRLYPFLLSRERERIAVYAHLNCPYIQEHWQNPMYREYAAYLQSYLSQRDILDFLKGQKSWMTDYSSYRDELDYVFTLVTF